MKNLFLVLSFLFISVSGFANHNLSDQEKTGKDRETSDGSANAESKKNRVECSDEKTHKTTSFRPWIPSLISTIAIAVGEKRSSSTELHLAFSGSVGGKREGLACGAVLDYKKCTFNESLEESGYSFTFTCGDTSGEFSCDKDCVKTSGSASFKCEGPKVDKKKSGIVFTGCKLIKDK